MYYPIQVDADVPEGVHRFMRRTVDLYLEDVHALLRLPLPTVGITAGGNFAIAAVLLNVISGASVHLYDPVRGQSRNNRGALFTECLKAFYPWESEPNDGVRDGGDGADILYKMFRNPLAHSIGVHKASTTRHIQRLPFQFSEGDLLALESSSIRPVAVIVGAPTLQRHTGTVSPFDAISLTVEPFYWGVRRMLQLLANDRPRMLAAAAHMEQD